MALAVVSLEKGFKSPCFSSLFLCFAIFRVFCHFCIVLFFGVAFVEILYFLFFVFWALAVFFSLRKSFKYPYFSSLVVFCDVSCCCCCCCCSDVGFRRVRTVLKTPLFTGFCASTGIFYWCTQHFVNVAFFTAICSVFRRCTQKNAKPSHASAHFAKCVLLKIDMDCLGTYFLHMPKPNVTRVQSATQSTASGHT